VTVTVTVTCAYVQISIWLGLDGKVVLDSSFDLGSMKDYVTNPDDAFYLVVPVSTPGMLNTTYSTRNVRAEL
jgi:hypothetical protein